MNLNISRRTLTIIYIAGAVVLLVYLLFAVTTARMARDADHYTEARITIYDPEGTGFVTAADVDRLLGGITKQVKQKTIAQINTRQLLQRLLAEPTVEDATVVALNSGVLAINVTPMQPVLRLFDGRRSFYYNAAGKRVPSAAGHYVDVPVVYGNRVDSTRLTALLPMLDFVRRNPAYDALVTSVYLDRNNDIIVIPAVTGHVINMGDTTDIPAKFERVTSFYHRVMPVKGWQYYDTISVKWRGRVVATKRTKKIEHKTPFALLEGMTEEVEDAETMSTDAAAQDAALRDQLLAPTP